MDVFKSYVFPVINSVVRGQWRKRSALWCLKYMLSTSSVGVLHFGGAVGLGFSYFLACESERRLKVSLELLGV